MELVNKPKSNCLFTISVFELFAHELINLIVYIIMLLSTFGHNTIFKENYFSNNSILRSECFEKSNIQELKARSLLRELVPNINIFFANSLLK